MGTLTQGQISKKKFEVGPEVVQPGPELVQPGPEVVQIGPLLVHSNISSTVNLWTINFKNIILIVCDAAWLKISLCFQSTTDLVVGS